jgi:hypothetical protein
MLPLTVSSILRIWFLHTTPPLDTRSFSHSSSWWSEYYSWCFHHDSFRPNNNKHPNNNSKNYNKKDNKNEGNHNHQVGGGAGAGGGGVNNPPKRKGKCHLCGIFGHWAQECPTRRQDNNTGKPLMSNTTNNTTATTITAFLQMGFMHIEPVVTTEEEVINVSSSVNLLTGLKASEVLLDNKATTSVFIEPELLTNIRPSKYPVTFVGIGGSQTSNLIGDCREFGSGSFIRSGVANILSFSAVEEKFGIKYQPNHGFIVTVPNGGEYHFKKSSSGLYVCDFDKYPVYKINAAIALVQTVSQNEQLYT